jgi:hypothetical protein
MNKTLTRLIKIAAGAAAGALIGFLYYKFIGCRIGTCPLTSSAVKSAVFGAVMGFLFGAI